MKYFQLRQLSKVQPNKSAFSLVELTIIIALMALIAALTIPSVITFKQQYVVSELYALQSTIWYLQQQAIAENKQKTILFNSSEHFYESAQEKHKLSRYVKFDIIPGVLGPPSHPQKQLKKAFTCKENKLVITPEGIISPGTIYLVDDKKQFLYAITVPIAGVSFTRLYYYRNKQWHVYI